MIPGLPTRLKTEIIEICTFMPRYEYLRRLCTRIEFVPTVFQPNILAWVGGSLAGSLRIAMKGDMSKNGFSHDSLVKDWSLLPTKLYEYNASIDALDDIEA